MNAYVKILDDHRSEIRALLALPYEVGGFLDLSAGAMEMTVQSRTGVPLLRVQNYPFHPRIGKIDWHTHYNSIYPSDKLPPDAPRLIPSDTDVMTLIKASKRFGEPCVSVILSRWGYFFFGSTSTTLPMKKIATHLEYANYDFFIRHRSRPLNQRVVAYITALERIGVKGRMVFRRL